MKRPWWITMVILVVTAAAVAVPLMIGSGQTNPDAADPSILIKIYPAYAAAAGLCAWLCWPARKELTWILLGLLILSAAGSLCVFI